jgi:hypothetical protein
MSKAPGLGFFFEVVILMLSPPLFVVMKSKPNETSVWVIVEALVPLVGAVGPVPLVSAVKAAVTFVSLNVSALVPRPVIEIFPPLV